MGGADDQREIKRWLLEVGCGMSTAASRLLPDVRRLSSARSSCFKYCFCHSYDYISGPPATDRSEVHTRGKLVALVYHRAKNALVSGDSQCKNNSLTTAVSPLLSLAVAGAPESSSLAAPQQADLTGPREAQRGKSLLVTAAPSKELLAPPHGSQIYERPRADVYATTAMLAPISSHRKSCE